MSTTPFPLPIMLDAADRKALRARAHHLDPVIMIGEAGLTRAVLDETDRALRAHELIKVRVLGDDRAQRQTMSTEICSALGCTAVQSIGKLLVLYRPRPIEDLRRPDEPHVPKKRAAQGGTPAKKTNASRKTTKRAPSPIESAARPTRARAPAQRTTNGRAGAERTSAARTIAKRPASATAKRAGAYPAAGTNAKSPRAEKRTTDRRAPEKGTSDRPATEKRTSDRPATEKRAVARAATGKRAANRPATGSGRSANGLATAKRPATAKRASNGLAAARRPTAGAAAPKARTAVGKRNTRGTRAPGRAKKG